MNINRKNYEVYIIDHFDGKLDPLQTAELMYFLSQNPDLEYEFNAFEKLNLPADKLQFIDKKELKKSFSDIATVTDKNFEEFCVAEIEGDLDEDSKAKLYQYMDKDPHKKGELELFRKTKLQPDKSVVFPGIIQLKKHRLVPAGKSRTLFYTGIAAAVLLFVFLTFIFRKAPESEMITGIMPVSEDGLKTVDDMAVPTPEEKTTTSPMVAFEDSGGKPKQENQKIHFINDVKQSESREDIEMLIHLLKPIEVRQIDNSHLFADVTLLKRDRPVQLGANPPAQNDKSLAEFIREKLLTNEIVKSAENLNVWTFAQASLKGINYLTESDVQMSRKLNKDGEISEFSIKSESFSFSAPLKK